MYILKLLIYNTVSCDIFVIYLKNYNFKNVLIEHHDILKP